MESGQEQNGTETEEQAESHSDTPMSPSVAKLVSEWAPMELCFGIPLFDERTNQEVCDRVRPRVN